VEDAMSEAIIVTAGDPAGIGAEVILKSLSVLDEPLRRKIEIVGSRDVFEACAARLGSAFDFNGKPGTRRDDGRICVALHDVGIQGGPIPLGHIDPRAGDAAYRYVVKAVELLKQRPNAVLASAPLNKEALNAAGHAYDGHTGLLTHLTGAKASFMLLTSERLSTIHVSTHVSLGSAIAAMTLDRVVATIRAADKHFRRFGMSPRIAIASLNPHAGEGGLFGNEDQAILGPAAAIARREGIDAAGPFPAHTIFRRAYEGAFDVVVAQYHDQGHIPMALVAPESTINVSLGLPLDRVSVDHGTAFDIAGSGRANPANMLAVLRYADRLARTRHTTAPDRNQSGLPALFAIPA
jgi:4-hydroxythreonine-4-phosphate dehydrogenase